MWQEPSPATPVAIAAGLADRTEPFPAAVLDLYLCRASAPVGWQEADLDLGGIGSVHPQVPLVHQPVGWLPGSDLTPIMFEASRCALEDPPAVARLEEHREAWLDGNGV